MAGHMKTDGRLDRSFLFCQAGDQAKGGQGGEHEAQIMPAGGEERVDGISEVTTKRELVSSWVCSALGRPGASGSSCRACSTGLKRRAGLPVQRLSLAACVS